MTINLEKYFERIGYQGSKYVSVETLKNIHAAQIFSIPFENLEIHEMHNRNNLDDFIHLDHESLFKKLVTEKRGGYCHENNELLALVLTQLGFKVERLAARVLVGTNVPRLPRGHKFLLVTVENQKFIADVGFGSYGIFEPLPLIENEVSKQYGDSFKLIIENEKYYYQIYDKNLKSWKSMYEFNLEVFEPVDFEQMSYNVSHNPKSIFVKNRLCVMPTPEGRIILNNFNLKIDKQGQLETITLKDEKEYFDALKKYFGIELPKNTQLKPIGAITNTSSWCNYFTKAAIALGIAGSAYIATNSM